MKKYFFSFSFMIITVLFLSGTALSQFTFNSWMNPVPGNKQATRSVDTTNVNPGLSGANVNWNFGTIVYKTDTASGFYVTPSSTPYFSTFPSATIAINMGNQAFSYYSGTSSYLEALGTIISTPPSTMSIIYSNPLRLYQYPLAYGQSFTDSYLSRTSTDGGATFSLKGGGTATYTNDAYGNITMPSGTVSGVVRYKKTSNGYDSINLGGITMVTQYKDTTWSWYKNNYKFPLFIIRKFYSTDFFGVPIYSKSVTAVQNVNVGVHSISSEIPDKFSLHQNYPNPFNPSTKIMFEVAKAGFVSLSVFDALGREVNSLIKEHLKEGKYETEFDGSDFTSGVYFYRLTVHQGGSSTGDYTATKKMILTK